MFSASFCCAADLLLAVDRCSLVTVRNSAQKVRSVGRLFPLEQKKMMLLTIEALYKIIFSLWNTSVIWFAFLWWRQIKKSVLFPWNVSNPCLLSSCAGFVLEQHVSPSLAQMYPVPIEVPFNKSLSQIVVDYNLFKIYSVFPETHGTLTCKFITLLYLMRVLQLFTIIFFTL